MCVFVFVLFSLIGSMAFAQELIQPISNEIVEEFRASETPEIPAVVQDSASLPVSAVQENEIEEVAEIEFGSAASEPSIQGEQTDLNEAPEQEVYAEVYFDPDRYFDPEKKWYFSVKPGYYYFSDNDMRKFFNDGGFTFRAEAGCKIWHSLMVWFDGGYFQKSGQALGGTEKLELKLATITLGLKGMYEYNSCFSFYAGAGPRLFMMMMDNDSPHVRGTDNEIGIGAGIDAGIWCFPIPQLPNVFFDLFADYSWKQMSVEPDEISSLDHNVDLSGLTAGIGLGVRF